MTILLAVLVASLSAADPIRVQLTTGGHDHDLSFYSVLDDPQLAVRVNPHPIAFLGDLRRNTDVLVLYDMTDTTDEKQMANLRAFVEAGRGVVVLHHALLDNKHWPWWYEEVVGGLYRDKESKFKHDIVMDVKAAAKHPVLTGIPANFRIEDEGYRQMWLAPGNTILLQTQHPDADPPLAWISAYTKARVVVIQLGHGPIAHRDPNYRRLVRNAVRWVAGRSTAH